MPQVKVQTTAEEKRETEKQASAEAAKKELFER